ncbi:hypothetical protein LIER_39598 [Lithospermum erythrorhizon]|uniref:Uncharacterized protein n=1 Tax=Lithospermum erythrorhizon TaxID=34254 RepID=A0AAV3QMV0_LITER
MSYVKSTPLAKDPNSPCMRGTDAYTPRPGLRVWGLASCCAEKSPPGQRHRRGGSGEGSPDDRRGIDHPSPSGHRGEHEGQPPFSFQLYGAPKATRAAWPPCPSPGRACCPALKHAGRGLIRHQPEPLGPCSGLKPSAFLLGQGWIEKHYRQPALGLLLEPRNPQRVSGERKDLATFQDPAGKAGLSANDNPITNGLVQGSVQERLGSPEADQTIKDHRINGPGPRDGPEVMPLYGGVELSSSVHEPRIHSSLIVG